MSDYTAPVRDMMFVLNNIAELPKLAATSRFADSGLDQADAILEEAGRFFSEIVAPTNRDGDTIGAQWHPDHTVTTPPSFHNAYDKLVEAGWGAVPFDPEIGGGGFPWVVGLALQEMMTSSNMALSLCPLLTQGAIHLLDSHGSEEQRMTWLPKMTSGEWTGTMNLTEPQAGSDVGALTTKAIRNDDGTYAISGQKIFITFGEHDLASNIVHLVLARTPDAPPGTRGISVFIVPKFLLDADGNPGERNGVKCLSIEHKMGIHGSPTCVLEFENATGYLIGEEQTGMASMFTMMNSARLSVGLEGLAVAERAYQQAVQYSHERLQGYRPDMPKGEQVPILLHPNIRRMLLTMRSTIEAMRCLCYLNGASIDFAESANDPDERRAAQAQADLLTPLSKAWCTDMGNELTSLNVQIHGGMGFIEETGAAQYYRDIRIGAIYEGTNGVQALDLIGRKVPMEGGAVLMGLLGRFKSLLGDLPESLADLADPLNEAIGAVESSSMWLASNMGDDALAGATPYLHLLATTVAGSLMLQSAVAAEAAIAGGDDDAFYHQKIVSARFFITQLLPPQVGLVSQVTGGNELLGAYEPGF